MQYCTLEKEGFLGTFYERETPSEKAVILVGGSGEGRAVKVLQPCARKIGMSGLPSARRVRCCVRMGKSPEVTQRLLAKMMTMEAKYPEESNRACADSWTKLVDFFQTNMVRRCLLCQRNCAARFRAGFWHF
ncbi:MAG: hypothetical protein BHW29_07395 [Faecalibacterium sp. CAG:74_58_120]|nr:MAG: hypothetical protein BHW29_07395 [Faecalibacterium sp. CAG:74_58_120]